MPESRVRVGTVMTWSSDESSSALLKIRVAETDDQRLLDESLACDGARIEEGPTDLDGTRPLRLHPEGGSLSLRYGAGVAVDGGARICPRDERPLPEAGELAFDLISWTLPSRYCASDALGPTAEAIFGDRARTRALIPAVADWVRERIVYRPGASDHLTTAEQTLLAREGVCRDMAHLAVSFLRALEVPARVLAAYAPRLDPPDFHALLEAHDGSDWRIIDVTGLAPVETLVRITAGRDAADIAWASASGTLDLNQVEVTAVVEPS